jgi:hypothetical protein
MGVPKIAELRRMSDDGLIAGHDQIADLTQPGVSYYLDELARRGQLRQADKMLGYTRRISWMTLVVTVATIVNVAIAFLRR